MPFVNVRAARRVLDDSERGQGSTPGDVNHAEGG